MSRRAAVRLAVAASLALALAPGSASAASGGVAAPGSDAPAAVGTPTLDATASGFTGPATTLTATPSAPVASTDPNALVGVAGDQLSVRPAGHRLTGAQAQALADRVPKIVHVQAKNKGSYPGVFMKGQSFWQVSYYAAGKPLREIGQVKIDDQNASVVEAWTGFQVPWTMARGYKGAFGHKVNRLWVWIPLCILFIAPFINPRRPFRWLHLDLLVLLGFSASLAYFNHGKIGHSVPIVYPLMAYLLARMLWIGLRRNAPDREPLKLLVPVDFLLVGLFFLIGIRIGFNVVDSNVIDVGDASSIGGHLLAGGHQVYNNFPSNISQGDTYGPVTYEAYVPFVKAFGFDEIDMNAAHAAAIAFDLLTMFLLWILGRRIRGPKLGIILAYAWAAYPFTMFVTSTNSNDGLVALLLVVVLLSASRPAARGVAAALAGFSKFAPLALAPLLATQQPRWRPMVMFCAAFAVATVLIWLPIVLEGPSLHDVYERTIDYQRTRGAPFSIWGYPGWPGKGLQNIWQILSVVLALALAVVPRRRDIVGLAALCGAIIIATQMGVTYWFYLYIAWFFPMVIVAIFGQSAEPSHGGTPEPAPIAESAMPERGPEYVPV